MSDLPDFARQAVVPVHPTTSSRFIPVMAWGAVLLASDLSHILWVEVLRWRDAPLWDPSVRLLGLAVLLAFTWLWSSLRPLRGFLLAVLAAHLGWMLVVMLLALPQVSALPPYLYVFVTALLLAVIPCGLMALTLIDSGLSRQALFLMKGNLRARSQLLAFIRLPMPWTRLGPILIVLAAVPLAIQLTLTIRPDFALIQHVLPALPIIVAFAIINALQEEFRFRMVFLARLVPVLGSGQAFSKPGESPGPGSFMHARMP